MINKNNREGETRVFSSRSFSEETRSVKAAIIRATWLVWGLRFFFLDLPFPPSPVWVVLGAELGCFRAAGASFDQLPEAIGAVGVRCACDLPPGGSDRGLLPRSTSSSERWC
ncbi:hypothetical protein ACOSQ3_009405 [Xanthoceras sorbifolium]